MIAPTSPGGRWPLAGVVTLAALALLVYGRTVTFDFVNYDDTEYVTQNGVVLQGLTGAGARWAFTETRTGNWIPLTWLSHMLDFELFGTRAGGHHGTNVLLHALNAVLAFLSLRALTGRAGPSFCVAVLFCVHPQRVESVAWISERKDLLSGTFFFASLLAYAAYARRPGAPRMLGLAALFVGGLLSKSMLVTLPFLLCLLDLWPLGRWSDEPARVRVARALREKALPLALALGFAVLTYLAQDREGAVSHLGGLSLAQRLANAGLSVGAYLRQTVWPFDLAVFYPHPVFAGGELTRTLYLPGFALLGCALAAIAWALFRLGRRPSAASVGTLWFLGMLLPVIGLVQVGEQAHADRYAYLPLVGVYVALVFPLASLVSRSTGPTRAGIAVFAAVALLLAARAWDQVGHWRSSKTLFAHALAVTEKNYVAHNNYGLVLLEERRIKEAGTHFERAVELFPLYLEGNYNLGITLQARGRFPEAVEAYRRVLGVDPGHLLALQRVVECREALGEAER